MIPSKEALSLQPSLDDQIHQVVDLHFHPRHGTAFWLDRQKTLGIDARKEIHSLEDLLRFGPMTREDLAGRPLEDFVPKFLHPRKSEWVVAETGGTLGPPTVTMYLREELRDIFVRPFSRLARHSGFPTGANWLYAGPTGPHIIGMAAQWNSRDLESPVPFMVDLDPRWVRKMVPGTPGHERYLRHVLDQSLRILRHQDIGVIFATPPLLTAIAGELEEDLRRRVEGLFYGGLPVDSDTYRYLTEEAFPNAAHLSGYGNTLFGLALQQEPSRDGNFDYYYPGNRVHVRIVDTGEGGTTPQSRLPYLVGERETGQVVLSRLDESMLILNYFERDQAMRLPIPSRDAPIPSLTHGLRNPCPIQPTDPQRESSLY